MKRQFRMLLALGLIVLTLLTVVSCGGGNRQPVNYGAKEDEVEKYNNLSDSALFTLYKASLTDEEREKLKDTALDDLSGTDREAYDKFVAGNYFVLGIADEAVDAETTRKVYVLNERLSGFELADSGVEISAEYTDMFTLGYKFVEDDTEKGRYVLEKLTESDKKPEPAKEAEFYNKLSDKGRFQLYCIRSGAEKDYAALEGDETLKTAFESFKLNDLHYLNCKKVEVDGEVVESFYLTKLENKEVRNKAGEKVDALYIEMVDRGYSYTEEKDADGRITGKYNLTAKAAEKEKKGIVYYILMPVGKMMAFLNRILNSYIFALFIFALLIKIILFPFGIRQQKSMVKQAMFKPKERAIRNKYKGRTDQATVQKMNQEIMDAQQKEGVSAFGGCLPLLIQLPVILLLYQVIINPLQYVAGYSTAMTTSIKNVLFYNSSASLTLPGMVQKYVNASSYARIRDLDLVTVLRDNWNAFGGVPGMASKSASDLPNFYAIGNHIDLSFTPTFRVDGNPKLLWYLLIPVITFAALYFSMKLNKKLTGAATQPTDGAPDVGIAGKIMDLMMPAISTYFTFLFPAVLGIYWIFNNVLGTIQQFILCKMIPLPVFTEEDYRQAEKEYNKGASAKKKVSAEVDPNKPKPKSLLSDDEEDYPELPPITEDDSVFRKQETKKGKNDKAPLKKDGKDEKNGKDE